MLVRLHRRSESLGHLRDEHLCGVKRNRVVSQNSFDKELGGLDMSSAQSLNVALKKADLLDPGVQKALYTVTLWVSL